MLGGVLPLDPGPVGLLTMLGVNTQTQLAAVSTSLTVYQPGAHHGTALSFQIPLLVLLHTQASDGNSFREFVVVVVF